LEKNYREDNIYKISKLRKLDESSFEYSELFGEISNDNIGLIEKQVNKFVSRSDERRIDVFAAGREGLLFAIRRYDVNSDFSFGWYASTCISGYIMKWFNANNIISLPSCMAEAYSAVRRNVFYLCKDKKSKFYKKYIFVNKKGEECEIPSVLFAISKGHLNIGLEYIPKDEVSDFSDSVNNNILIKKAFEKLSDEDRYILSMRYEKFKKLREVADEMNVSISRVQYLETKAIRKLKKELKFNGIEI
jgi:RNA polymerase sigma factor (sigma-70 family)